MLRVCKGLRVLKGFQRFSSVERVSKGLRVLGLGVSGFRRVWDEGPPKVLKGPNPHTVSQTAFPVGQ